MIDNSENVIFVAGGVDVAGKHVSGVCVVRWILRGCRSRNGQTIRLRGKKVGGRWATSREAVDEFLAALSNPSTATEPIPPRTPTRRQRAAEDAERELTLLKI